MYVSEMIQPKYVGQKLIYVVVQNSFVLEMDLVKNEILISRKKTNSYS
jgi:hypothetical protein